MTSPLVALLDNVEEAVAFVSRHTLGRDFAAYCDLCSAVALTQEDRQRRPDITAPYIFLTHNGAYASVFDIQGASIPFNEDPALTEAERLDPARFDTFLTHLHTLLVSDFQTTGHKLSLVFERDPRAARSEIAAMVARQFRSCVRTGIDLHDIIQEKIDKLAPLTARERAFLVVYSAPALLPASEKKEEIRQREAQLKAIPPSRTGQDPLRHTLEGLKIRHDALLAQLESGMRNGDYGVHLQLIDAHQAGFALREETERSSTAPDWRPFLPGDICWPHGHPRDGDPSCLLPPHLNYQLFNSEPEMDGDLVKLDGHWHGTLALTLGPQRPEPFSKLFAKINRTVPWRLRIDLMPGGIKALSAKRTALSLFGLLPNLRPVYRSVEWLTTQNEKDPVCMMSVCASAWAETPEAARRNLTLLQKGLQSWGVCEVTRTFGDPLRAWTNTLLASSANSIRALMYPPLSAALRMLPLTRPDSPWQDDPRVVFQTRDGKPFGVDMFSPLFTKLTTIVAGDSGSGKSVLLNVLNEAIISTGQSALPFLSIIDKGFTAQGLIRLLQECLPPARRDEVAGIVLENRADFTRNPFDVQLGLMSPLTPEREYLLNLLEVLCIDPETGLPPNAQDCRQILGAIVDMAYQDCAETRPRRYARTMDPQVDILLDNTGLLDEFDEAWLSHLTWYELRDLLFARGHVDAASRAHYQAMPELNDLQGYLNDACITGTYGNITRKGSPETLLSYIARTLRDAASTYPVLSGPTRFALNPNTRVIAVDLNNVCGAKTRTGQLKTGLMYLFAGQLATGHFALPQYEKEFLTQLPALYMAYHTGRLEQLKQEVKTRVYDELHNVKDIPMIIEKLDNEDRENRKFFISTVFSSQFLSDMPEKILRSANSLYLMQIGQDDMPLLTGHFGVPHHTAEAFRHVGVGASPDGSGTHFLAIFRLKSRRIVQILKNTVGPRELWALNSTPKDSALRDQLYARLSVRQTLDVLAKTFPSGSAEKIINLRQKDASEHDHGNIITRLASELTHELGYRIE